MLPYPENPLSTRNGSITHCDWLADRQARRRLVILVVVIIVGGALLTSGHDIGTVLLIIAGTGLVGATVARWVVDAAPMPTLLGRA